jgi:lincosamide nucleotidyltransferase A/C/D/E
MIEIDTMHVNYHRTENPTRSSRRMMSAQDVLQIVTALGGAGVGVWLDGGWGIDALVGEQTRPHDDLDCIIALADAEAAHFALAPLGFAVIESDLPTRFVVRDARDRRVDFHSVTFDDEGGGSQTLQDGTLWPFPPDALLGSGVIAGQPVPCLTAEVQALAHVGYEPDEKDVHDMRLLARHYGIDLPEPYRETR